MPFGRTESLVWAWTSARTDLADAYLEKIDWEAEKYFYDGEWRPLKKKEGTITVRFGEPVSYPIYSTHRGPVFNNIETDKQLNKLFQFLI